MIADHSRKMDGPDTKNERSGEFSNPRRTNSHRVSTVRHCTLFHAIVWDGPYGINGAIDPQGPKTLSTCIS